VGRVYLNLPGTAPIFTQNTNEVDMGQKPNHN